MINYCRKSTDMVILLSQRSLILILCNLDFNTVTEVGNPVQPCGCLCVMVWLTFVGLVQQIIQSTPCGLKALDVMSAETVVLPLISVTCLIFFILSKDRPIKVLYCQKIIIVPMHSSHTFSNCCHWCKFIQLETNIDWIMTLNHSFLACIIYTLWYFWKQTCFNWNKI